MYIDQKYEFFKQLIKEEYDKLNQFNIEFKITLAKQNKVNELNSLENKKQSELFKEKKQALSKQELTENILEKLDDASMTIHGNLFQHNLYEFESDLNLNVETLNFMEINSEGLRLFEQKCMHEDNFISKPIVQQILLHEEDLYSDYKILFIKPIYIYNFLENTNIQKQILNLGNDVPFKIKEQFLNFILTDDMYEYKQHFITQTEEDNCEKKEISENQINSVAKVKQNKFKKEEDQTSIILYKTNIKKIYEQNLLQSENRNLLIQLLKSENTSIDRLYQNVDFFTQTIKILEPYFSLAENKDFQHKINSDLMTVKIFNREKIDFTISENIKLLLQNINAGLYYFLISSEFANEYLSIFLSNTSFVNTILLSKKIDFLTKMLFANNYMECPAIKYFLDNKTGEIQQMIFENPKTAILYFDISSIKYFIQDKDEFVNDFFDQNMKYFLTTIDRPFTQTHLYIEDSNYFDDIKEATSILKNKQLFLNNLFNDYIEPIFSNLNRQSFIKYANNNIEFLNDIFFQQAEKLIIFLHYPFIQDYLLIDNKINYDLATALLEKIYINLSTFNPYFEQIDYAIGLKLSNLLSTQEIYGQTVLINVDCDVKTNAKHLNNIAFVEKLLLKKEINFDKSSELKELLTIQKINIIKHFKLIKSYTK